MMNFTSDEADRFRLKTDFTTGQYQIDCYINNLKDFLDVGNLSLYSDVSYLWICMRPITRKGTLWELRKVSTMVSLRSPRRLTMVETFRYWQIFCVLSDKLWNCIGLRLASFPLLLFCLGAPISSFFA